MSDWQVHDFVSCVYKAVAGKTKAFHTQARCSHSEPWVELYVGDSFAKCRAELVDSTGILGEWDYTRGRFYPLPDVVLGTPCPYRLLQILTFLQKLSIFIIFSNYENCKRPD